MAGHNGSARTHCTARLVPMSQLLCVSCFRSNEAVFRRVGLFQAPTLTAAHQIIGLAAVLGFLFTIAHLVTVIVTCATAGFGWGVNAWMFDMMGFLAGFCFACLCKKNSNTRSAESRKDNFWIAFWAGITLGVRVLDVLMHAVRHCDD